MGTLLALSPHAWLTYNTIAYMRIDIEDKFDQMDADELKSQKWVFIFYTLYTFAWLIPAIIF